MIAFAVNSYAFNQDRDWSDMYGFGRSANGTIELPGKRIGGRNSDRSVNSLQVSMSGSRQVATWVREVGAGTNDLEYVTRVNSGDEWSGYRVLSGDRSDPQKATTAGNLSTDAAGNAIIGATDVQPPPGTAPVPREFFLPAADRLFSGPRPFPAGVAGTRAQLKDAGDGQRYWTTQVGAATHLWFASRSAGAAPTYGTPQDIGSYNGGTAAVAVGPNGHTAVLWLVQQGLDTKVQALFGAEPPAARHARPAAGSRAPATAPGDQRDRRGRQGRVRPPRSSCRSPSPASCRASSGASATAARTSATQSSGRSGCASTAPRRSGPS